MKTLAVLFALCASAAPAAAQHRCPCTADGPCWCEDCACNVTYAAAYARAVRQDRPLLVFVGQRPIAVADSIVCRWDDYPGGPTPRVVFGLPDGKGGVNETAHRDGYPTKAWIEQRVRELLLVRLREKDKAAELARRLPSNGMLSGVPNPLWMNGSPPRPQPQPLNILARPLTSSGGC